MYEFIPQKTNQKAIHIIGISMIGGVAILGMTTALSAFPFRWAVQLAGIVLIGLAIFFYTRYMSRGYVYRVIKTENGTLDFLVDEYQRKKRTTVCRVGVSGISEIVCLKANEKEKEDAIKANIKAEHRHAFDYTVDWMPNEVVILLCEEGGELFAIRIQPDETLLKILGK